jgi:parallel beta-helix repeat protein
VGCVAGDDDTGTGSIEQPFTTYDMLRSVFPQLKPGEAVAFCRGGSFSAEADRYWNNPSCSASEPCVITDYEAPWAKGTEAAPIIAAGDGAGFAFRNDALEQVSGLRLQNVDVRGITTGIGVYVQGAFADLSLCGLELSGMRFGVNLVGDNERLRLRGSHIHDLTGSAFLVGAGTCNDCSIEDNLIADVSRFAASVPPPDDAIVFWGGPHLRSRIVRNRFSRYGENEQGACARGAITVHGPHEDLLVASNTMAAPFDEVAGACGGVLIDTQATRSVLRSNRFTDLGHVALRVMDCDDCVIENNVVESGRALQDMFGIDVQYSSGTKVRNNTVHFDGLGRGVAFAFHELSGGVLANNLIVNSAAAPEFDCFLGLKADAQIFDFFDNNGCWFPNVVDGEWAGGIGSLTQWRIQSLPAMPDHSSFYADPGLDADLRPLPGAYLIGRGNAEHAAPVDFDGDERHTPPDVGAYEH